MRNYFYFIFSIFLTQGTWAQSFNSELFRPPLDIPLYLSGNFGELRGNHFHSGIDIKTQGTIGHRVYAAGDGYISRIKVETGGYGNTIYITHPSGHTTVYGHLDRFREDIADDVRKRQYQLERHAMNIYPEKNEWPVKSGDFIAFSGTTGYSFGPHLHFEIRSAARQEPMNVLRFGFDIKDNISPRIYALYAYPMDASSHVDHARNRSRLQLRQNSPGYRLSSTDTLMVGGSIGLGIEAFDYLDGARNRCGLYRTVLKVDGEVRFEWQMDMFAFSESRYINSYIDYREKHENRKMVQKLYVDPNNRLRSYKTLKDRGLIRVNPGDVHQVEIVLEDVAGNQSRLSFALKGSAAPIMLAEHQSGQTVFRWDTPNEFSRNDIRLVLPEGVLYRDLEFTYARTDAPDGMFAPLHYISDPGVPLHGYGELRIRPDSLPAKWKDKALIVYQNGEDESGAVGGEWRDDWLVTEIRNFGRYSVAIDSLAPTIIPLNLNGSKNMRAHHSIRFRVDDDLSGIGSYEGYIDNHWALFEYDAKNQRVIYRFDPERLEPDQTHELELYITDNQENIAYYYTEFYW